MGFNESLIQLLPQFPKYGTFVLRQIRPKITISVGKLKVKLEKFTKITHFSQFCVLEGAVLLI